MHAHMHTHSLLEQAFPSASKVGTKKHVASAYR